MLGFVVGTACLIGLIKVLRRGHGYGCGYTTHHCGPGGGRGRVTHPWDRFARDWDDVGRDGDSPMLLRGLFVKLGTTPGQERVIVDALRELKGSVKRAVEERAQGARQIAEALRGEDFKVDHMGEAYVHLDAGAEAVRDASFAALAKIHAVLDEGQRRILADFIARGGAALENLAAQA
ncbi:MAG: hypothetical protein A2138_04630 [Deltaproteobacteria bacterium RBG_16_71_12]|nr:MAG: hypothetical protein A2138_04630 [Deltaproteobacteria bacterium RBG_16_71_12]